MKKLYITSVLIGLSFMASCSQPICPDTKSAVPLEDVVARYNVNASKIPRLWARAEVSMTFREKPSDLGFTWRSGEPTSYLLLDKMMAKKNNSKHVDFTLIVKETINEIARVGISTQEGVYYSWMNFGKNSQCQYGRLPLAGAPGVTKIAVDPTQLLAVLAVCALPADSTTLPMIAQTYSSNPCAYVLTVVDRQPVSNKLLFRREIYFDRSVERVDGKLVEKPRRPFLVRIFDDMGRAVLTGRMNGYKHIAIEDVDDESKLPTMPTDINLRFEETGAEIRLQLSDMTTEDKVIPEAYLFVDRLPERLKGKQRCVDSSVILKK